MGKPDYSSLIMSSLYLGLGGAGIDAAKAIYDRSLSEKAPCNKNQYLLIGRGPRNLYVALDKFDKLKSEKEVELTEFR